MSFLQELDAAINEYYTHYDKYPNIVIIGKKQMRNMVDDIDFNDYYSIDFNLIIKSMRAYYAPFIEDLLLCLPERNKLIA